MRMRVHDNEIIMEMRVFWRWVLLEMHLEMRTFKDAFVVAVASFFPDEFSLFLLVVFGGEVVSTAAICSRLVVHPIKDFIQ